MRKVYRVGKAKPQKRSTEPCPYCRSNGGVYDKSRHPRNHDCAGTKVSTRWT